MARQQQIDPAFFRTVTHLCPALGIAGQALHHPGFNSGAGLGVGAGGIYAGKHPRRSLHQLPGVLELTLGIVTPAQPHPGIFRLTPQHGTGVGAVGGYLSVIRQLHVRQEAFVAANQPPFYQRFRKLHVLSEKSTCHKAGTPVTYLLFSANSRFRTNAIQGKTAQPHWRGGKQSVLVKYKQEAGFNGKHCRTTTRTFYQLHPL